MLGPTSVLVSTTFQPFWGFIRPCRYSVGSRCSDWSSVAHETLMSHWMADHDGSLQVRSIWITMFGCVKCGSWMRPWITESLISGDEEIYTHTHTHLLYSRLMNYSEPEQPWTGLKAPVRRKTSLSSRRCVVAVWGRMMWETGEIHWFNLSICFLLERQQCVTHNNWIPFS